MAYEYMAEKEEERKISVEHRLTRLEILVALNLGVAVATSPYVYPLLKGALAMAGVVI